MAVVLFEPHLPSFAAATAMADHPSACCGMPHLGARYTGPGVNAYRLDDGALCAFCGRPAAHAHHEPPKGTGGGVLHLATPHGVFDLRPALVALCPECHEARHAKGGDGRLSVRWEWDTPLLAMAWWRGDVLAGGTEPHSPELFGSGRYALYRMGYRVEVRRSGEGVPEVPFRDPGNWETFGTGRAPQRPRERPLETFRTAGGGGDDGE